MNYEHKFVINLLFGMLIIFLVLFVYESSKYNNLQEEAIRVGAAYYHPQTARFTWKTNLIEINK